MNGKKAKKLRRMAEKECGVPMESLSSREYSAEPILSSAMKVASVEAAMFALKQGLAVYKKEDADALLGKDLGGEYKYVAFRRDPTYLKSGTRARYQDLKKPKHQWIVAWDEGVL